MYFAKWEFQDLKRQWLSSIVETKDTKLLMFFFQFVNFQKWLKLVHKVKKKPFTVDSKLPPDLQIKVKVSDDDTKLILECRQE